MDNLTYEQFDDQKNLEFAEDLVYFSQKCVEYTHYTSKHNDELNTIINNVIKLNTILLNELANKFDGYNNSNNSNNLNN